MEIVAEIAEVGRRQLGYLNYNDKIRRLTQQAHYLTKRYTRVQGNIDAATRNNEQIADNVEEWVERVKEIIEDANKFLEVEGGADTRCLNGWCINLRSRYRLGKEAQKMSQAIYELQQEESFENVSYPASMPGIISASMPEKISASRQFLEAEVMKALNNKNVSMIGICGMGGVGKTTLVKKIGKQAEEDKLFDKVVMAVVSQNPNLTKIQGEIANMLGLTLEGDVESARARSLWERIKKEKRILVILEDVWGRLELDRVGIPWGNDHKGCRIVLTSRRQDVCSAMDAQKILTVGVLSEEESWDLFREAAGEIVDSLDINPIARKVAAKCGGLPIAILTVGRALKNNKMKDEWNDALNQIKNAYPTNIREMNANVFSLLKLSYDCLTEEAKSCFLLCCLFPEDFNIPVEALVRYGWGLRLFQNVYTVEEARCKAHTHVSTLIASCLLLESQLSGFVRMHDIVRDFAISIATDHKLKFMVKAGLRFQDWPNDENFEDFAGISLMSCDIHELPDGYECPKLQTLLLQNNSPLKIHDMFFMGMKELKVLDMSDNLPLSLPPSLSVLANLQTLRLDGCRLGNISGIGKLSRLEILSFSKSNIKEIPRHFGQLSRLRLFDLTDCEKLTLIPPGVISSLCRLEELFMQNSFLHWDVDGGDSRSNASLFELQALPRLTSLHIRIPNASSLPTDMPFQDLTTFTISIGNQRVLNFPCSRALSFTYDTKIPLWGWVKNLINRTEHLDLTKFIGLRNIIPDLDNNGFNELKFLSIDCCEEMNYLLDTLEWPQHKAFHSLKQLYMYCLPELMEIWKGHTEYIDFCNLEIIKLIECKKLKTVFPPSLLHSLINLKDITIASCNNMEEIFGKQEKEEERKEIEVWKKDPSSVSATLGNLTRVSIKSCEKMRNLFSPSIVRALAQLQELSVMRCRMMQEIVTDEEIEEGASMVRIVFPCLKEVWLQSLENLTSFCPGRCTLEWPALESLEIIGCPKMETFGYGDQVTPKLEKVSLKYAGREWLWMGDLNATVQHLFKNQVMTLKEGSGSAADKT